MSERDLELTAYRIAHTEGWSIEPAPAMREWMQQTAFQVANRCLPLVIANQAGWVIRCPYRFKATWNGKQGPDALVLEFPDREERAPRQISSIFGEGIISFSIPWLFRTSDGYALQVRGPTNSFKDSVVPLDGLVETDWSPYTFTMNWKVTKPKTEVWFKKDEPVCMIAPFPIGILERFAVRHEHIESEPDLFDAFLKWRESRSKQYRDLEAKGTPSFRLDYVRGSKPDGTFANAHWSRLKLAEFPLAPDPP